MVIQDKEKLIDLVQRYQVSKSAGQLENSSEATMRTWIDELLSVFGWDVQNTKQVLTEHTLGRSEKVKLRDIGSTNTRPDYTLVNGSVLLTFVDAKSLAVNIESNKDAAFQIRSYGWSIGAPFAIITNFEQLAIYDCSIMPNVLDEADYACIYFYEYTQFVEKFDILKVYLYRENIIEGNIKFIKGKGNALDENFSRLLGDVRKEIAKAILDNNDITNVATLSFYVQTIINRVLFIRVCESRGLEKDKLLLDFAADNFWEAFKRSSYAEFYDHYDGPMFKKIAPLQSLSINSDVFTHFLNSLYYPSPYRFDVIPLKTISDIYDLFLGYQLVVRNGKVTDELKEEFKKSNGAVTTPKQLVNNVLDSTFSTSLKCMSILQILKLSIVDIACGSGVFIVGAYEYIVKEVENRIRLGEPIDDSYYILQDGNVTLTIKGRKAIINNCLYGVDINPEAVEVAKMSLSLKLIENYAPQDFGVVGLFGSQILKGIGENIRCGNSLVGPDIEEICPTISDDINELQLTNAFDWQQAYPNVFKKGGFDYVIGNPPYVEVKNYNCNLPTMAMYIKRVYSSSKNGKIDLAIPFIERGISLLNDNGRLGYIVQKRFFKTEYGKGIRKLLSSKQLLNGIYDYTETDLFVGRITYVAIIVCDNNKQNNTNVWYLNSSDGRQQLLQAKSLGETPWNFENVALNALRLRLSEELGTLGDVCHIKVGLQMLWNDAYQIVADHISNGILYGHSVIDNHVEIEFEACRPLLCNEQFAPLTKRLYTTFALFPYFVTANGEVTELSISEFTALYPKAGAYLAKHKNMICKTVETLPQRNGDYNSVDHWHLFTRANNHGAIYEKLCVPMTAQYTQAAVVMDKHVYCDNANMFFIQIDKPDEKHLYALAAIINSTIFNTLARSIANPQQGGYYKFNKQFLDPVPFPKDAFIKCGRNIANLANIAKKIEKINDQISNSVGSQTSGLVLSLNTLWRQLDLMCDKLYGIKKAEDKALLYSTIRKDRTPYEQES
ncbi:MAG: Eco57I restriction-modification methylase domain-containing protein [Lepagella sp.]